MPPPRILAEYQRRHEQASTGLAAHRAAEARWRTALLGSLVLLLVLGWREFRTESSAWPIAAATLLLVGMLLGWRSAARRAEAARRQTKFYAECVDRASGLKPQTGNTGEAFALGATPRTESSAQAGELFSADLEVLGPFSLFSLLATTRTGWGDRALAGLLLQDADTGTLRHRQAMVQELSPRLDLRESVALLGTSEFVTVSAGTVDTWLGLPEPRLPAWLSPALLGITAAWLVLLGAGLLLHWSGGPLLRNLAFLWAAQSLLCWRVRPAVLPELKAGKHLAADLRLLREGLALLSGQSFGAEPLQHLQRAAAEPDGQNTSRSLRRLERTLHLVEQRETNLGFVLGLFFAAGTQEAAALVRWRQRHANNLRQTIGAWAEFESLVAVATYASEQDESSFPEYLDRSPDSGAVFDVVDLKHPLLSPEKAVGNTLSLRSPDRQTSATADTDAAQFLLISGSNMAGKSTLLRTIGLSVVLGRTGAPLPARQARLTALRLGASIGAADSLADGRSKFLAEVERLRGLVSLAHAHPGEVLFLVDEILSGTNSADRKIAAEAVVRGLLKFGAIGALSTHDLSLVSLADEDALHGRNVHMASTDGADPLGFDYLLKDGPNRITNGLAIVRLLGLLDV